MEFSLIYLCSIKERFLGKSGLRPFFDKELMSIVLMSIKSIVVLMSINSPSVII